MTKINVGWDFRNSTKVKGWAGFPNSDITKAMKSKNGTTDKSGDFSSWVRICTVRAEMSPQSFYIVTAASRAWSLNRLEEEICFYGFTKKLHVPFTSFVFWDIYYLENVTQSFPWIQLDIVHYLTELKLT